ncbi:MAG: ATP-binding cassette domain-containing protein, partial [Pseudomonadota bacterium]
MSLTVRDLSVTIGQRTILSNISFSAEPGAITAIVGPNGSGKSTLLKAICGEVPYQGQISLNGQSTASLKPWQLAAMRAVLPQASSLAFPFTVREVVQIGLQAGVMQGERATVAKALAKFGLSGFEDRFYQELSGGEQQRVQMARVLAQVW